ncbi:MAG: bis(5'-nucleosyl)-tetraphosphatase (symmetrical) YqeK [Endomicrobia bacterium]|jgi:predicted HD superfamily hydrolase involved in NAD metabolism|nr:bis(5'-nucleosyl)-tetraphosphatase (symmetrical) YqeK [Endomicrobiia bacterium]
MKDLEKNIFKYLSRNLSPKRFEHSYNVSKLSVALAERHGESILKAQTAALLHDCAKNMSGSGLVKTCTRAKIKVKYFDEIKRNAPHLLHSHVSAYIAKKHFRIKDKNILAAIENHTLGRPDMSVLEKIIFIADYASLDRKHKHASKIRKTAMVNLEEAFIHTVSDEIKYIVDKGIWLCMQSVDTWNYYAKKD